MHVEQPPCIRLSLTNRLRPFHPLAPSSHYELTEAIEISTVTKRVIRRGPGATRILPLCFRRKIVATALREGIFLLFSLIECTAEPEGIRQQDISLRRILIALQAILGLHGTGSHDRIPLPFRYFSLPHQKWLGYSNINLIIARLTHLTFPGWNIPKTHADRVYKNLSYGNRDLVLFQSMHNACSLGGKVI
jgi:hypothetical protein